MQTTFLQRVAFIFWAAIRIPLNVHNRRRSDCMWLPPYPFLDAMNRRRLNQDVALCCKINYQFLVSSNEPPRSPYESSLPNVMQPTIWPPENDCPRTRRHSIPIVHVAIGKSAMYVLRNFIWPFHSIYIVFALFNVFWWTTLRSFCCIVTGFDDVTSGAIHRKKHGIVLSDSHSALQRTCLGWPEWSDGKLDCSAQGNSMVSNTWLVLLWLANARWPEQS